MKFMSQKPMLNTQDIENMARRELEDEEFREAVDKRKEEIRSRRNLPWYNKLFPYKIRIERI